MSNSSDVGPSGLNPTGGFALPDVDSLDAAAQSLRQHADDFLSGVATSTAIWRGLSGSYSSDESPTVLAAFGTIMPSAQRVQGAGASTSTALATFSSTCRDLKQRLEAYGRQVHALDADIGAFPTSVEKVTMVKGERIVRNEQQHWTGEADLTARHDTLAAEVKAIHDDYLAAQNTCAGALAAASGGETYTVSRPAAPDLKTGNWMDELLWNAGTFLGKEHPQEEQPWGKATVPYRPNGVVGLLQGFGAGLIETVDGVWSLTGTLNPGKRDQAWGGVNAMVGAAGTLALVPLTSFDAKRREEDAPKVQEALDLFGSIGPAFIHQDEADTNAGWAAGATTFNVASLFVGAGAGAGVKAGTLATKTGMAAERLSVVASQSTRLSGTSAMLGTTANALKVTGIFLDKPGSLALKVSDILMPNTTAKVQDTMTKASVATWAAITDAKSTAVEAVGGAKRLVASGLEKLADDVRAVEASFPGALIPEPSGVMTRTGIHTGLPELMDNKAATIRENNPPAFVPPKAASTDVPTHPAEPTVVPDHFVHPTKVENTIIVRHGDLHFPVSRRDNFAAKTGLEPNTEYIVDHRTKMKDADGGHDANTLEKFYTDENGNVTIVNTYAGVRGAWSVELNKPMPNVTYNVVAQVDGGLQNTFTLKMDNNGHLASAKGHIVSTLVGDANRNGYQQRKAGWLGGRGYDGGHAAPSALGFIGERGGIFPQHEWQNRKAGTPNEIDEANNFHDTEMEVIAKVKRDLTEGKPIDLTWEMTLTRSNHSAVPPTVKLEYSFGSMDPVIARFNNLKISE
ncbi:DNA/RNA non-specific endonuclease [Paenarthrobacter nitroguajacolicus]|uniref:DNA/RNA non-specific endonuclease n=1 Tax=Paenarthrobacter nitroguajacolicus TaxID=211146 RepID=UPI0021196916|nr:DNA/RNA non-specific endonuclease [Paenarthrobacter nitroguajacolicus]